MRAAEVQSAGVVDMAGLTVSAFNTAHCICKTPASQRLSFTAGVPPVRMHGRDGRATNIRGHRKPLSAPPA